MSATAAAAAAFAASAETARPSSLAPPPLPLLLLPALPPSSIQNAAELDASAQMEIGHLLDGLLFLAADECCGCHVRAPTAVSAPVTVEVPTEDTKEHAGGVILSSGIDLPHTQSVEIVICPLSPAIGKPSYCSYSVHTSYVQPAFLMQFRTAVPFWGQTT